MSRAGLTVSVVITNYNYAAYVGRAIESVLNQTHAPDQIIVIDDGSSDNSREVIASYPDRVHKIFKANEGFKATTNRGFHETNGDILIYLDADDVLYPDAIEEVLGVFRPGTAKVQFDLDIIDRDGIPLGRKFCNFPREITPPEIASEFSETGTYVWPPTSGNAYAREFLDRVMPLDPPLGIDGALNTIAPLYGQIGVIARPLGQYRIHFANMSQRDGSGNSNIVPDFARKINFRKQEFELLRRHAAKLGMTILNGDFLDNELTFINYRLMARKIEREDGADSQRPTAELWSQGMRLVLRQRIPGSSKLMHMVWLTALCLAPSWCARAMIELRYNRTHFRSRIRHLFARLPKRLAWLHGKL